MVLARAPLDLVPMDWDINALLARLSSSIADGSYRPSGPQIVRSAKSSGLTRPLAILAAEDQLVYKVLVSLAESDLMRGMQEWTRFGRADARDLDGDNFSSESGWFRAWSRRQGHLWTITENHRWIVETDIANFFPSIQLPFLVAHVQALSRLDEGPVRLLCRILEDVAILPAFRKSATVGLPQENFDCSRVLAHTHLRTVDDEFLEEGSRNRYSRYMDDVVIGANSKEEAIRFVARIQRAMEQIGLYPNTAKTRIVSARAFRLELMKPANDLIGEIQEAFANNPHDQDVIDETNRAIDDHLGLRARPRAWERVLRRWYTTCRTQRNPVLLPQALKHLAELPGSAPHILDYLTVFPMDANRVRNLVARIDDFGGVYEDIEIMAHECICQAPGSDTDRFRALVSAIALQRIRTARSPWIAVSACTTLGKYGRAEDFQELYRMAKVGHDRAPWKLQALMVLLGAGTIEAGQAIREWRDRFPQATEIAFLEAVLAGERRAVTMLADFISPREALTPHRWVVRTRSLFMVPVLSHVDNSLWTARSNAWRLKILSNPPELADRAVERWWERRLAKLTLSLHATQQGVAGPAGRVASFSGRRSWRPTLCRCQPVRSVLAPQHDLAACRSSLPMGWVAEVDDPAESLTFMRTPRALAFTIQQSELAAASSDFMSASVKTSNLSCRADTALRRLRRWSCRLRSFLSPSKGVVDLFCLRRFGVEPSGQPSGAGSPNSAAARTQPSTARQRPKGSGSTPLRRTSFVVI